MIFSVYIVLNLENFSQKSRLKEKKSLLTSFFSNDHRFAMPETGTKKQGDHRGSPLHLLKMSRQGCRSYDLIFTLQTSQPHTKLPLKFPPEIEIDIGGGIGENLIEFAG